MAVLLYVRVSGIQQAGRELSIPAQIRIMKRYCEDRGLIVADVFQDVASARFLRGRPGLIAAVMRAEKDPMIDMLLVHRIDRLSRNVFNHLILKGRLRQAGVRICSVVEGFDDSPMGEFLEHIMAAQSEFYSANLAQEVRKGLTERLEQGRWNGAPPLGYLMTDSGARADATRTDLIREAFELWSTGTVTSEKLAEAMYVRGLTSRNGKRISKSRWCAILQNPFYIGIMKTASGTYPGLHSPLVSKELFDRCQTIFKQKHTGGRPQRRLTFLLTGKILCPRCAQRLTGEEHRKRSGKKYSYYRCHGKGCGFGISAPELEDAVSVELLNLQLPERAIPKLRKRIRLAKRTRDRTVAERIRNLRANRRALDDQVPALARAYKDRKLDINQFMDRFDELQHSIRVTEGLLAATNRFDTTERGDVRLLKIMHSFNDWIRGPDPVKRREALDTVVADISIVNEIPEIGLKPMWQELFQNLSKSHHPGFERGSNQP